MMRLRLALLLAIALAACGTPPSGGTPWPFAEDQGARRWGDGPYGLVLVSDAGRGAASWEAPATTFAGEGMTVVALSAGSTASRVMGAILALQDAGIERVAVLAAGSGSAPALELGATHPELVDQLILLSAAGGVGELGVFPKLFVASQDGEAATVAERMADEAPGDWNALYLASGDAEGQAILEGEGADEAMEAIVARLEERR
jgi:pimeloyl-ACP methyl ester carboxylesterase